MQIKIKYELNIPMYYCINVYYYVKCIMYLCYKIFNMIYGNNVYKGMLPVNNNNNNNFN